MSAHWVGSFLTGSAKIVDYLSIYMKPLCVGICGRLAILGIDLFSLDHTCKERSFLDIFPHVFWDELILHWKDQSKLLLFVIAFWPLLRPLSSMSYSIELVVTPLLYTCLQTSIYG